MSHIIEVLTLLLNYAVKEVVFDMYMYDCSELCVDNFSHCPFLGCSVVVI